MPSGRHAADAPNRPSYADSWDEEWRRNLQSPPGRVGHGSLILLILGCGLIIGAAFVLVVVFTRLFLGFPL